MKKSGVKDEINIDWDEVQIMEGKADSMKRVFDEGEKLRWCEEMFSFRVIMNQLFEGPLGTDTTRAGYKEEKVLQTLHLLKFI